MKGLQSQAEPLDAGIYNRRSPSLPTQAVKNSNALESRNNESGTSGKHGLDAMSLAKWNKLAERGGIGKAVALGDCMADRKGDLMFLAGDEITVLRALSEEVFLGHCEGVIGRFYRPQVRFKEVQPIIASSSNVIQVSSSDSSVGDETVVDESPVQTSTNENLKLVDQQTRSSLGQNAPDQAIQKGMKNCAILEKSTGGEEDILEASPDQAQGVARQVEPLASTSPSIASTRSRRPTSDTQMQIKAESVAMALRRFGAGSDREEGDSFGRTRQSRDSSLDGSECSWSSTHESDEISEGSIHYPTISFIDRLKASRIPAAQLASAQSVASVASAKSVAEEKKMDNDSTDVATPSLELPSAPVVLQPSPPPRPQKSRFRSQPAEGLPDVVCTNTSTEVGSKDAASEEGPHNASTVAGAEAACANPLILEDELTQGGGGDVRSNHTRESNPFEFGIGVSAASTPSGIMTPAMEDTGIPSSSHLEAAASPSGHPELSGQTLTVPGGALARELANRFSSNSEVLRKHHINEEGDQSYFPIVPVEQGSPKAKTESPLSSDPEPAQPATPEPASPGSKSSPIPEYSASCLSIPSSPISRNVSEPPVTETHGLGLEPQDHGDSWNILDDYVDSSPIVDTLSRCEDSTSQTSASVPAEAFPMDNRIDTPVVKKKPSGILKIRTTPQPDTSTYSPRSTLTPTSAQTFQQTSPEGSMSPDTHRFRAFAMTFPSPSQTPTKSTSGKALSAPSSGQKSAEATRLVQEDTLHGQLAMDLTSARNPVPINFLLGHSTGSPLQYAEYPAAAHTPPQRVDRGTPSPANGKHSPKAPSSPFFPTRSDKPRTRSFSIVEVPLPLHKSDSSNSLQKAYAGVLQNGHVANQQRPVEEEDKVKRSLSRKGSAKLSALRRKLSLKGEDRPDLSSILHNDHQPPLPDRSSTRSFTARKASVEGQPWADGNGIESHSLPPLPSTPIMNRNIPPVPVSALNEEPPKSVPNPAATVASLKPAIEKPSRFPSARPLAVTEYDQYGFLADQSPVPPFAPPRMSEKEVTKLEQTLLSLTDRPQTSSSSQKVKALVESYLPPSVRGRVWSWLLNAPVLPHQQYQSYIDSFDIPQLEMDPSLIVRFGNHRAFIQGFHSVQQMMFLYIIRHQNAPPPPPDTIWIASVFLSQSFHDADAYALYESFLGRISESWTGGQLRQWAEALQEAIQAHDRELATHLATCPDLYYTVLQRWCLTMFAEAMPLPTCLRAIDLVIAQGVPAIIKLASVIILLCTKRLLTIFNPKDLISYLRQPSQEWLSPENVIQNTGKIALPKTGFHSPRLGSPRT
ncbi:hypothetical protein NliqN6_0860 [Naganishia liquefaciens]|uniref:Rab-GAP TBC domain-containing protein n=1 Tax=Naganishia liquefaciens TaxID=104408 RepID=A0A8H3YCR5_9TREE|nr:hypothetical protein NliqN6_0860 [Naganishia liquefaciens]